MTALEAARVDRGYTIRGLGKRAGVDHTVISRLERKDRPASIRTWRKLARALGVQDYRTLLEA